jgi:hypothetical protein
MRFALHFTWAGGGGTAVYQIQSSGTLLKIKSSQIFAGVMSKNFSRKAKIRE